MSSMKQLKTAVQQSSKWVSQQQSLTNSMMKELAFADKIGPVISQRTNVFPVATKESQINKWKKLHSILHESIGNIVLNFGNDDRIENILNLDNQSMNTIKRCQMIKHRDDYLIGSFRPDLVIGKQNNSDYDSDNEYSYQICEINARFALNGYFITSYCGKHFKQHGCLFSGQNDNNNNNNSSKFLDYPLANKLFNKRFDFNKSVYIIKNREYGNDLYLFEFAHSNSNSDSSSHDGSSPIKIIHPNAICIKNDRLYCTSTDEFIEQIVLELHQDELFSLDGKILDKMIEMDSKSMLNDFRTILITHNKRFLSILSNVDILKDYINYSDAQFLVENVVPTVACPRNYDEHDNDMINILNHEEWILKPSLLGKGEGIIFGDECTELEWNELVKKHWLIMKSHVLQKYIEQETFEFPSILNFLENQTQMLQQQQPATTQRTETTEKTEKIQKAEKTETIDNQAKIEKIDTQAKMEKVEIKRRLQDDCGDYGADIDDIMCKQSLVATLLCVDDEFMGPGIYRSSPERLIAVSRGGEILLPIVTDSCLMNQFDDNEIVHYNHNYNCNDCNNNDIFDSSWISEILTSLDKNGKCVVVIDDETVELLEQNGSWQNGDFLKWIVDRVGLPILHNHKSDSTVWDIIPNNESMARSHNSDEFELHTDSSFEEIPPRYFALQCIENDRFNGGLNQLISVESLVNNLDTDTINTLTNSLFAIKIPKEFSKENSENSDVIYGSILSNDKKMIRYRSDIIDKNLLSIKEKMAIENLDCCLNKISNESGYYKLNKNSILFVDNCTFLHSRTAILDMKRHLKRIRFQPKEKRMFADNFNNHTI